MVLGGAGGVGFGPAAQRNGLGVQSSRSGQPKDVPTAGSGTGHSGWGHTGIPLYVLPPGPGVEGAWTGPPRLRGEDGSCSAAAVVCACLEPLRSSTSGPRGVGPVEGPGAVHSRRRNAPTQCTA